MRMKKFKRGIMSSKNRRKSKYDPHQGKQEKARRKKQYENK